MPGGRHGLIVGVRPAAGVGGVAVLLIFAAFIALAFGSLGAMIAIRTGSTETVQSMFPIFFVFLFISAMALPLELLQTQWFHDVAAVNPVTYLLEAFRSLLFEGWDAGALALGFGIAAAVLVIGMALASRALKTRLVRT